MLEYAFYVLCAISALVVGFGRLLMYFGEDTKTPLMKTLAFLLLISVVSILVIMLLLMGG